MLAGVTVPVVDLKSQVDGIIRTVRGHREKVAQDTPNSFASKLYIEDWREIRRAFAAAAEGRVPLSARLAEACRLGFQLASLGATELTWSAVCESFEDEWSGRIRAFVTQHEASNRRLFTSAAATTNHGDLTPSPATREGISGKDFTDASPRLCHPTWKDGDAPLIAALYRMLQLRTVVSVQRVLQSDPGLRKTQSVQELLERLDECRSYLHAFLQLSHEDRESQYWIPLSCSTMIYTICRYLRVEQHASICRPYLAWALSCLGSSALLLAPQYLAWKSSLALQTLRVSEAERAFNDAIRVCARMLGEVTRLELYESMEPPVPPEIHSILAHTRFLFAALSLKYKCWAQELSVSTAVESLQQLTRDFAELYGHAKDAENLSPNFGRGAAAGVSAPHPQGLDAAADSLSGSTYLPKRLFITLLLEFATVGDESQRLTQLPDWGIHVAVQPPPERETCGAWSADAASFPLKNEDASAGVRLAGGVEGAPSHAAPSGSALTVHRRKKACGGAAAGDASRDAVTPKDSSHYQLHHTHFVENAENSLQQRLLEQCLSVAGEMLEDILGATEKMDKLLKPALLADEASASSAALAQRLGNEGSQKKTGAKKSRNSSNAPAPGCANVAPGVLPFLASVFDAVKTAQRAATELPEAVHAELFFLCFRFRRKLGERFHRLCRALDARLRYRHFLDPPLVALAVSSSVAEARGSPVSSALAPSEEAAEPAPWAVASCDLHTLRPPRAPPTESGAAAAERPPIGTFLLAQRWDWERALRAALSACAANAEASSSAESLQQRLIRRELDEVPLLCDLRPVWAATPEEAKKLFTQGKAAAGLPKGPREARQAGGQTGGAAAVDAAEVFADLFEPRAGPRAKLSDAVSEFRQTFLSDIEGGDSSPEVAALVALEVPLRRACEAPEAASNTAQARPPRENLYLVYVRCSARASKLESAVETRDGADQGIGAASEAGTAASRQASPDPRCATDSPPADGVGGSEEATSTPAELQRLRCTTEAVPRWVDLVVDTDAFLGTSLAHTMLQPAKDIALVASQLPHSHPPSPKFSSLLHPDLRLTPPELHGRPFQLYASLWAEVDAVPPLISQLKCRMATLLLSLEETRQDLREVEALSDAATCAADSRLATTELLARDAEYRRLLELSAKLFAWALRSPCLGALFLEKEQEFVYDVVFELWGKHVAEVIDWVAQTEQQTQQHESGERPLEGELAVLRGLREDLLCAVVPVLLRVMLACGLQDANALAQATYALTKLLTARNEQRHARRYVRATVARVEELLAALMQEEAGREVDPCLVASLEPLPYLLELEDFRRGPRPLGALDADRPAAEVVSRTRRGAYGPPSSPAAPAGDDGAASEKGEESCSAAEEAEGRASAATQPWNAFVLECASLLLMLYDLALKLDLELEGEEPRETAEASSKKGPRRPEAAAKADQARAERLIRRQLQAMGNIDLSPRETHLRTRLSGNPYRLCLFWRRLAEARRVNAERLLAKAIRELERAEETERRLVHGAWRAAEDWGAAPVSRPPVLASRTLTSLSVRMPSARKNIMSRDAAISLFGGRIVGSGVAVTKLHTELLHTGFRHRPQTVVTIPNLAPNANYHFACEEHIDARKSLPLSETTAAFGTYYPLSLPFLWLHVLSSAEKLGLRSLSKICWQNTWSFFCEEKKSPPAASDMRFSRLRPSVVERQPPHVLSAFARAVCSKYAPSRLAPSAASPPRAGEPSASALQARLQTRGWRRAGRLLAAVEAARFAGDFGSVFRAVEAFAALVESPLLACRALPHARLAGTLTCLVALEAAPRRAWSPRGHALAALLLARLLVLQTQLLLPPLYSALHTTASLPRTYPERMGRASFTETEILLHSAVAAIVLGGDADSARLRAVLPETSEEDMQASIREIISLRRATGAEDSAQCAFSILDRLRVREVLRLSSSAPSSSPAAPRGSSFPAALHFFGLQMSLALRKCAREWKGRLTPEYAWLVCEARRLLLRAADPQPRAVAASPSLSSSSAPASGPAGWIRASAAGEEPLAADASNWGAGVGGPVSLAGRLATVSRALVQFFLEETKQVGILHCDVIEKVVPGGGDMSELAASPRSLSSFRETPAFLVRLLPSPSPPASRASSPAEKMRVAAPLPDCSLSSASSASLSAPSSGASSSPLSPSPSNKCRFLRDRALQEEDVLESLAAAGASPLTVWIAEVEFLAVLPLLQLLREVTREARVEGWRYAVLDVSLDADQREATLRAHDLLWAFEAAAAAAGSPADGKTPAAHAHDEWLAAEAQAELSAAREGRRRERRAEAASSSVSNSRLGASPAGGPVARSPRPAAPPPPASPCGASPPAAPPGPDASADLSTLCTPAEDPQGAGLRRQNSSASVASRTGLDARRSLLPRSQTPGGRGSSQAPEASRDRDASASSSSCPPAALRYASSASCGSFDFFEALDGARRREAELRLVAAILGHLAQASLVASVARASQLVELCLCCALNTLLCAVPLPKEIVDLSALLSGTAADSCEGDDELRDTAREPPAVAQPNPSGLTSGSLAAALVTSHATPGGPGGLSVSLGRDLALSPARDATCDRAASAPGFSLAAYLLMAGLNPFSPAAAPQLFESARAAALPADFGLPLPPLFASALGGDRATAGGSAAGDRRDRGGRGPAAGGEALPATSAAKPATGSASTRASGGGKGTMLGERSATLTLRGRVGDAKPIGGVLSPSALGGVGGAGPGACAREERRTEDKGQPETGGETGGEPQRDSGTTARLLPPFWVSFGVLAQMCVDWLTYRANAERPRIGSAASERGRADAERENGGERGGERADTPDSADAAGRSAQGSRRREGGGENAAEVASKDSPASFRRPDEERHRDGEGTLNRRETSTRAASQGASERRLPWCGDWETAMQATRDVSRGTWPGCSNAYEDIGGDRPRFETADLDLQNLARLFLFCIQVLMLKARWHQVVALSSRFNSLTGGVFSFALSSYALAAQQQVVALTKAAVEGSREQLRRAERELAGPRGDTRKTQRRFARVGNASREERIFFHRKKCYDAVLEGQLFAYGLSRAVEARLKQEKAEARRYESPGESQLRSARSEFFRLWRDLGGAPSSSAAAASLGLPRESPPNAPSHGNSSSASFCPDPSVYSCAEGAVACALLPSSSGSGSPCGSRSASSPLPPSSASLVTRSRSPPVSAGAEARRQALLEAYRAAEGALRRHQKTDLLALTLFEKGNLLCVSGRPRLAVKAWREALGAVYMQLDLFEAFSESNHAPDATRDCLRQKAGLGEKPTSHDGLSVGSAARPDSRRGVTNWTSAASADESLCLVSLSRQAHASAFGGERLIPSSPAAPPATPANFSQLPSSFSRGSELPIQSRPPQGEPPGASRSASADLRSSASVSPQSGFSTRLSLQSLVPLYFAARLGYFNALDAHLSAARFAGALVAQILAQAGPAQTSSPRFFAWRSDGFWRHRLPELGLRVGCRLHALFEASETRVAGANMQRFLEALLWFGQTLLDARSHADNAHALFALAEFVAAEVCRSLRAATEGRIRRALLLTSVGDLQAAFWQLMCVWQGQDTHGSSAFSRDCLDETLEPQGSCGLVHVPGVSSSTAQQPSSHASSASGSAAASPSASAVGGALNRPRVEDGFVNFRPPHSATNARALEATLALALSPQQEESLGRENAFLFALARAQCCFAADERLPVHLGDRFQYHSERLERLSALEAFLLSLAKDILADRQHEGGRPIPLLPEASPVSATASRGSRQAGSGGGRASGPAGGAGEQPLPVSAKSEAGGASFFEVAQRAQDLHLIRALAWEALLRALLLLASVYEAKATPREAFVVLQAAAELAARRLRGLRLDSSRPCVAPRRRVPSANEGNRAGEEASGHAGRGEAKSASRPRERTGEKSAADERDEEETLAFRPPGVDILYPMPELRLQLYLRLSQAAVQLSRTEASSLVDALLERASGHRASSEPGAFSRTRLSPSPSRPDSFTSLAALSTRSSLRSASASASSLGLSPLPTPAPPPCPPSALAPAPPPPLERRRSLATACAPLLVVDGLLTRVEALLLEGRLREAFGAALGALRYSEHLHLQNSLQFVRACQAVYLLLASQPQLFAHRLAEEAGADTRSATQSDASQAEAGRAGCAPATCAAEGAGRPAAGETRLAELCALLTSPQKTLLPSSRSGSMRDGVPTPPTPSLASGKKEVLASLSAQVSRERGEKARAGCPLSQSIWLFAEQQERARRGDAREGDEGSGNPRASAERKAAGRALPRSAASGLRGKARRREDCVHADEGLLSLPLCRNAAEMAQTGKKGCALPLSSVAYAAGGSQFARLSLLQNLLIEAIQRLDANFLKHEASHGAGDESETPLPRHAVNASEGGKREATSCVSQAEETGDARSKLEETVSRPAEPRAAEGLLLSGAGLLSPSAFGADFDAAVVMSLIRAVSPSEATCRPAAPSPARSSSQTFSVEVPPSSLLAPLSAFAAELLPLSLQVARTPMPYSHFLAFVAQENRLRGTCPPFLQPPGGGGPEWEAPSPPVSSGAPEPNLYVPEQEQRLRLGVELLDVLLKKGDYVRASFLAADLVPRVGRIAAVLPFLSARLGLLHLQARRLGTDRARLERQTLRLVDPNLRAPSPPVLRPDERRCRDRHWMRQVGKYVGTVRSLSAFTEALCGHDFELLVALYQEGLRGLLTYFLLEEACQPATAARKAAVMMICAFGAAVEETAGLQRKSLKSAGVFITAGSEKISQGGGGGRGAGGLSVPPAFAGTGGGSQGARDGDKGERGSQAALDTGKLPAAVTKFLAAVVAREENRTEDWELASPNPDTKLALPSLLACLSSLRARCALFNSFQREDRATADFLHTLLASHVPRHRALACLSRNPFLLPGSAKPAVEAAASGAAATPTPLKASGLPPPSSAPAPAPAAGLAAPTSAGAHVSSAFFAQPDEAALEAAWRAFTEGPSRLAWICLPPAPFDSAENAALDASARQWTLAAPQTDCDTVVLLACARGRTLAAGGGATAEKAEKGDKAEKGAKAEKGDRSERSSLALVSGASAQLSGSARSAGLSPEAGAKEKGSASSSSVAHEASVSSPSARTGREGLAGGERGPEGGEDHPRGDEALAETGCEATVYLGQYSRSRLLELSLLFKKLGRQVPRGGRGAWTPAQAAALPAAQLLPQACPPSWATEENLATYRVRPLECRPARHPERWRGGGRASRLSSAPRPFSAGSLRAGASGGPAQVASVLGPSQSGSSALCSFSSSAFLGSRVGGLSGAGRIELGGAPGRRVGALEFIQELNHEDSLRVHTARRAQAVKAVYRLWSDLRALTKELPAAGQGAPPAHEPTKGGSAKNKKTGTSQAAAASGEPSAPSPVAYPEAGPAATQNARASVIDGVGEEVLHRFLALCAELANPVYTANTSESEALNRFLTNALTPCAISHVSSGEQSTEE
ncbi:hypothetical protein BESB_025070 [Besnoitia besnoiti]|uniref:Uncharacterized protein n=1 Tax=Besnoitia besnoiti TaxID=94643 RepID=A0A2A9M5G3_BESBE|nr:uncharacterized protein BESB_025070 [Besnoitia besnoiti]PFH31541.1 hypothetical protein BESB_025070 [Besnoitia besnoiti]